MAVPTSRVQDLVSTIHNLSKTYQPNDASSSAQLLSTAQALVAAIQTSQDHVMTMLSNLIEASSIRALFALNVLQSIPTEPDSSISLTDLSTKTGVEPALLSRLLRVLTNTGFLNQHPGPVSTYSHNPISASYIQMPGSVFFPQLFDECATLTQMPQYFKERGAHEANGEQAKTHNLHTWSHGQEGKTAFEIMEQDAKKTERFQKLMGFTEMFRPYTGFYDYGKLASGVPDGDERVVFVDIGGGNGTTISKILDAHSEIKPHQCVLQDTASVISLAKQNRNLQPGIQTQPHDFFCPQPVIGAKAYHLRAIIHDWSDHQVIQILRNIVPAMAPDSKVLIADNVVPEDGSEVSAMTIMADMVMFAIGGKERTRSQFEKVLGVAGLKVDGVFVEEGKGCFGVVEASLR